MTQLVSLVVVGLIFFATIYVEGKRRSLKVDSPIVHCPNTTILKEDAYMDEKKGDPVLGYMECYCM